MGEGSQMEGSRGPKWRGQGVPCSWDWGSHVRGTGGAVFVGLGVPCSWDWGSRVRGTGGPVFVGLGPVFVGLHLKQSFSRSLSNLKSIQLIIMKYDVCLFILLIIT